MMMMTTYGALIEHRDQKLSYRGSIATGHATSFKYKEVIANHYRYRGAVDEHNAKRHDGGIGDGIGLEASWGTSRWENRVLSFILGVLEVNACLGRSYFGGKVETQIKFCRRLAFDLITYMDDIKEPTIGISPERLKSRT